MAPRRQSAMGGRSRAFGLPRSELRRPDSHPALQGNGALRYSMEPGA